MKNVHLMMVCLFCLICFSSCRKDCDCTSSIIIHGFVSDKESGELIQGAIISISPSANSKNVVTGSDGSYLFYDLEPRQYTLTAQKAGYHDNVIKVNAENAGEHEGNFLLEKIK